jgi:hypothetical protein
MIDKTEARPNFKRCQCGPMGRSALLEVVTSEVYSENRYVACEPVALEFAHEKPRFGTE